MSEIRVVEPREVAFDVETHDRMIVRIAGKVPETVLTIEQQIYTYRICEYTEPISYRRFWCFEELSEAIMGLANYLAYDEASEPQGWVKAIDIENGYRMRRARVGPDGQRVIVEDGEED